MGQWLAWARGPAFIASMVIMSLGLLRVIVLSAVSVIKVIRSSRRNGRNVPYGDIFRASLKYMVPIKACVEYRGVFSLTSVVFHVALILTPIFLGAHILLWERGLGLGWPALGAAAADYLTLAAILATMALFVMRVGSSQARALSRAQDYLLLLIVFVIFLSGYLAVHPAVSPISYTAAMLIHVLAGNLMLILIPLSKLSHAVLFPATQMVTELGWHLDPNSGRKVGVALGKENEPI